MSVDAFLTSGHSPGRPSAPRCRVALLGFGTVGSAIARRLGGSEGVDGLQLTHIFDRRAHAKRDALALAAAPHRACLDDRIVWTTRIDDVLSSGADVVVE